MYVPLARKEETPAQLHGPSVCVSIAIASLLYFLKDIFTFPLKYHSLSAAPLSGFVCFEMAKSFDLKID